jgi:hypothetical protein
MPAEPPFDPIPILVSFADAEIDFVVIGGVAGGAHGSAYGTGDVDLVCSASLRISSAWRHCFVSSAPGFEVLLQTFRFSPTAERCPKAGTSRSIPISAASISWPTGSPPYDQLREAAMTIAVEGRTVRVASLDHLIAMKEAAGRPKDLLQASEYRVISDILRAQPPD